MNVLVVQQRLLRAAIVDREFDDAVLQGLGNGREGSVTGRLSIYRRAYFARLTAALSDNFGVLPQVLGDDAFEALALAYIDSHPSQRPSIRWFGDRLPEFMAAHPDLVPHGAITDIARMEWALRGAFDSPDAEPIGVAALTDVPPEVWPVLVFDALPSVRLLPMRWQVEPVWRALQGVAPEDSPELPEPVEDEHFLVVWRQGLQTRWRSLDVLGADLLRAVLAGRPFAELCRTAAERVGEDVAAVQAATALRGWVEDGFFCAWHVTADDDLLGDDD